MDVCRAPILYDVNNIKRKRQQYTQPQIREIKLNRGVKYSNTQIRIYEKKLNKKKK